MVRSDRRTGIIFLRFGALEKEERKEIERHREKKEEERKERETERKKKKKERKEREKKKERKKER